MLADFRHLLTSHQRLMCFQMVRILPVHLERQVVFHFGPDVGHAALISRSDRTAKRLKRFATPELAADQLGRAQRKLGAVLDLQLVEDGVKIDLHRALGHAELGRDVAVAEALANQLDQLAFAARECRR